MGVGPKRAEALHHERGLGDLPDDRHGAGRRLSNMEARATRLGGAMHATAGSGSGTVIEWRVPTSTAR